MSSGRRGLARKSVIGVFWTGLSMGALGLAEIVGLLILARLLSPGDFGLYTAALIVIKFSAVFSGLGVAPAIVQRQMLEERHLRVGFTLSILLSLSVAALIWAAAPAIAAFLRIDGLAPVTRVACVVFLCQGFSMVALASAQRALRFRWLAGLDAIAFAVGFVVVGPVLALLGAGIWALVGALLAQHFLRMSVLLICQPHPKRPMLERRAIGELLHFGGGFTVARIFNYLAGQADRLVVGRFLGAETLGVYGLASQLMTAPAVIFGQILDRVLFPTMALVQKEPARLARAYRSGVAACAIFVLPASAVIVVIASELVELLLGPGWEGVVDPLRILAVGMLFRTSYKLSDSITRATGAVYARAWRQAAFAGAVFAGALIGQLWGIRGVAIGVVAAIGSNFLLMAQLSLRLSGMRWREFAAAQLPGLALGIVVWIGTWALAGRLRELGVTPLVLVIDTTIVALFGAVVLCWLIPSLFLGPDGRSVLRMVRAILPERFSERPGWRRLLRPFRRIREMPQSD